MTSTDPHAAPPPGAEGGPPEGEPKGPPWINPEIQQGIEWRDGDVVISVPIKSGTTWTMNIVHQLRAGGDPDLESVYAEVPWIEFLPGPTTTVEEVQAKLAAMPTDRRRAFKTHSPPPLVPFHAAGSGKDVKYIVVARSPDEAIASMYPFIAAHTDAWFDLWEVPREAMVKPDFGTFFDEVAHPGFIGMVFDFIENWWPHRNESNVLFMHFADMKRDHEGSVRKVADFLGYTPSEAQWARVLEYTSFPWMKAHQDKFEGKGMSPTPVLKSGSMVRKGKVGAAREDGVTAAHSERILELGRKIVSDGKAVEWIYGGGPLPD